MERHQGHEGGCVPANASPGPCWGAHSQQRPVRMPGGRCAVAACPRAARPAPGSRRATPAAHPTTPPQPPATGCLRMPPICARSRLVRRKSKVARGCNDVDKLAVSCPACVHAKGISCSQQGIGFVNPTCARSRMCRRKLITGELSVWKATLAVSCPARLACNNANSIVLSTGPWSSPV